MHFKTGFCLFKLMGIARVSLQQCFDALNCKNEDGFLISVVLFCHCPTWKFLKPSPTQMELVGNWRLDNRRGSTAAGMQTLWWISQKCRPPSSYVINLGCCSEEGANPPLCVSTCCQSSGLHQGLSCCLLSCMKQQINANLSLKWH